MEIRPGLFIFDPQAGDWVPDPEMPGAEMQELFKDAAMWAGFLRVVGADQSGTLTYPVRDMFVVLQGTCRLELDDGTVLELQPGSATAMPPGTTVRWSITAPYREFWVRGAG
jgi:hypothetical protein